MILKKKEENILLWNGQLLIKDGVYNGANLLFVILLPYNGLNSETIDSFVDNIFHSLIVQKTNKLDMKKIINKEIP